MIRVLEPFRCHAPFRQLKEPAEDVQAVCCSTGCKSQTKVPLIRQLCWTRVCPHERPGACSGDGHVPCQFKFKPIQVPSLRRGCLQPVHEVAAIAGEARCHLDLDGAAGESRSKRVDDAGLGRALPLFEETARFRRPTRKSILWFNAFCAMLAVCLCLRGDGQLAPGGFRAGFAAVAGAALGAGPGPCDVVPRRMPWASASPGHGPPLSAGPRGEALALAALEVSRRVRRMLPLHRFASLCPSAAPAALPSEACVALRLLAEASPGRHGASQCVIVCPQRLHAFYAFASCGLGACTACSSPGFKVWQ